MVRGLFWLQSFYEKVSLSRLAFFQFEVYFSRAFQEAGFPGPKAFQKAKKSFLFLNIAPKAHTKKRRPIPKVSFQIPS
jgi:hypothetical protein